MENSSTPPLTRDPHSSSMALTQESSQLCRPPLYVRLNGWFSEIVKYIGIDKYEIK